VAARGHHNEAVARPTLDRATDARIEYFRKHLPGGCTVHMSTLRDRNGLEDVVSQQTGRYQDYARLGCKQIDKFVYVCLHTKTTGRNLPKLFIHVSCGRGLDTV